MLKRILFLWVIEIALSACSLFPQTGAKVVRHQEADGLVSYTIVIPPGKFTHDFLVHMANEYLTRFHQVNILNVGILSDSAMGWAFAGTVTDVTFDEWRHEYEKIRQIKSLNAAELLKFGGAATLRIRYADGHIEEIPIQGKNVFHPTADGINLDLLYVAFALQGFPTKQLFPILYFRTSRDITRQEADELAKSIFVTSGAIRMEIVMRTDGWFIFSGFYPWLNPFASAGPPPSEAQAAKSAEYWCSLPGEATCYQSRVGTK